MEKLRIIGTGSHVPPRIVTNDELVQGGLDTSDEWITKRTGVRERRIADPTTTTSDLACEASRKALEMAGISATEIDMIIVGTVTPDTCCPSTANWLQAKLDAPRAVTFDLTAACSGFVFGLNVAEQYLKCGTFRTILVVGAEIMTRTLDWNDRGCCVLWGDGAGAAIVTVGNTGAELLSTHIHSDGANGRNILLPGGGSSTTPISHESVDAQRHHLRLIEGNLTFRVAVRRFMDSIIEEANHNNMAVDAIDWIIPHQANIRMFQNISQTMNIPMEKFYLTLQKYGNISAASCAIALDEAVRDGSIRKGQTICMPVFGGGLTWGGAMIRW
ncbi:MAG: ketoacyl-ACP synthase III [Desulfatitalea sp.]|nr:ketoacyl-ACP synthase III [Desulfatitalea sp.]